MTAIDSVPDAHRTIEAALREDLDDQWTEVLGNWEGSTSAQRRAVHMYVSGLRNRICKGLLNIETPDELMRGLALQYMEMKCHWMMLNTQIQQQTFDNGRADESLMYRATCVSLIIQALEPLLERERVDTLSRFLSEPFE
ncbi:hypothetical protein [Salisaeta longa]|uniref:hypothetical protein n=1 Tax=Salisaeta longa TaxID=503170 RepID=UPI0003B7BA58|nr:hypothetical protein [Salisaeta longa]